jgi:DNA-binding MarR family transcriptional regulator
MNAIFFASKRAYHAILRVTRRPLRVLGLTAARFDLMYALMPHGESLDRCPAYQSELRQELGVSAPTVSRMLRSLEKLGWVERCRPVCGDQRQREVTLTDAGLECIRTAYKAILHAAKRLVYMALCFGRRCSAREAFVPMTELEAYLRAMRQTYGDFATLSYPWHPDD